MDRPYGDLSQKCRRRFICGGTASTLVKRNMRLARLGGGLGVRSSVASSVAAGCWRCLRRSGLTLLRRFRRLIGFLPAGPLTGGGRLLRVRLRILRRGIGGLSLSAVIVGGATTRRRGLGTCGRGRCRNFLLFRLAAHAVEGKHDNQDCAQRRDGDPERSGSMFFEHRIGLDPNGQGKIADIVVVAHDRSPNASGEQSRDGTGGSK